MLAINFEISKGQRAESRGHRAEGGENFLNQLSGRSGVTGSKVKGVRNKKVGSDRRQWKPRSDEAKRRPAWERTKEQSGRGQLGETVKTTVRP